MGWLLIWVNFPNDNRRPLNLKVRANTQRGEVGRLLPLPSNHQANAGRHQEDDGD